jgi:hypothetical protein
MGCLFRVSLLPGLDRSRARFGDLETDGLMFPDFFPEGPAPVGKPDRQIERTPYAQATGGGGETLGDHHLMKTGRIAVQLGPS